MATDCRRYRSPGRIESESRSVKYSAERRGQRYTHIRCYYRPDLEDPQSVNIDGEQEVIRIPATAFLRSMAVLAWTAFRHPFSNTVIDLSTGKVISES